MRLAYIHNIAMPGPEANTVNVAKMCSAFASLGHDVTLIAAAGRDAHGDLGAHIRRFYDLQHPIKAASLPRGAERPALAALVGAAQARRLGADLVVTRAPHAALACCMAGLPTLLEVHADLAAFSRIGRLAFQRVLGHAKLLGVVVISDALAEILTRETPALAGRLYVAHDGADVHQHVAAPIAGARLSVGYVGRLYAGRGADIIAAAAALCPWADFHIVGGTNDEMSKLVNVALAPNLHCHGAVPHADVAARTAAFDVVVAPYQRSVIVADGRTDTARWMSPLKLFEYMAAGKAILASDLPSIRDILDDGETALLCTPDDAAVWAAALTRLRDDPNLRHRLGAAARAQLIAHYTWEKRAQRILDHFKADASAIAA